MRAEDCGYDKSVKHLDQRNVLVPSLPQRVISKMADEGRSVGILTGRFGRHSPKPVVDYILTLVFLQTQLVIDVSKERLRTEVGQI